MVDGCRFMCKLVYWGFGVVMVVDGVDLGLGVVVLFF